MGRLSLDFSRYSDPDLDTKAQDIITCLTNNANFPNLFPKMEDIEKAGKFYSSSLVDAQTRDKIKVAIKKSAKRELIEVLKALGNHIMSVAQGDEAILVSSGFTLTRGGGSSRVLANPQSLVVKPGKNRGEIVTSVAGVGGARAYIHEYTLDPVTDTSVWTSVTSTRRKHLFTNLQSGKNYWFRVAAVGPNGQVVYSAPQAHIVL
jgi:hypothetical protein